jgi:hypothetical protein
MFLNEALLAITGRPDLFAWRPTGELLRMNNRLSIKDLRSGTPRPFQIKLSDVLSDAWITGDLEKLQKYSAANWAGHEPPPAVGGEPPAGEETDDAAA